MKKLKLGLHLDSIFARLFISFLIVIVPILIMGIVMFTWGKETVKNQIENSAVDNVSFLQSNLESEVQNIKMLQYDLVNDNSLKQLVTEYQYIPQYDYFTMISEVQQRLQVMKNSNIFIQDVTIYEPDMGISISAASGYEDIRMDDYNVMLGKCLSTHSPVIDDNTGMYAVTMFPQNADNEAIKLLYLVKVELSQNKVESYLAKFSKYNSKNTALFDHSSKKMDFQRRERLSKK
jgi:two-component system sensor histidine kinase YesM